MSQTRQNLEDQIADDLARDDLSSQITQAVSAAIRAYRAEPLGFNERYRVTATLTSSAESMPILVQSGTAYTRFRKIDRLRLVRNANDYMDLIRRDYRYLMDRQDIQTASQPVEFAVYNDTIHFDAKSDQTYTVLIDGIADLGSAASATYSAADTSAWFNTARELIRHRAKREIYAHVLKDMELATVARAAETEALDTIRTELNQQNGTGFVSPTCF